MSHNEAWRPICIDATGAIANPVIPKNPFPPISMSASAAGSVANVS